jgi:Flp pilus assembly protein protease CpaA
VNIIIEQDQSNRTASDNIENKIKKINRNDLGRIFKKLEPNAFPYDKNQRDDLLQNIDDGNQLKPEDYDFISQTYSSHINELLPELDRERDNNWIISVTFLYMVIGIVFRLVLVPYEQLLVLFMGGLSTLAVGLALFVLSGNINRRINAWISQAVILDEDKKVLLSNHSKTKHLVLAITWAVEIVIIIVQFVLYHLELLSIGNDSISILAFGIALFSDNVETFFVRKFEAKLMEVEL